MSDYNIDTGSMGRIRFSPMNFLFSAFRRIDLLEEGNDLIRVDIRLIFLRIGI